MIIILSGLNKSGKTTLANKIKELGKFEYIKCSQPKIENGKNYAFEEYMGILDKIDKDKNYIIDRFHFGSFVYGPLYRNKEDFSLDCFYKIEERLLELDTLLILCIASDKFLIKKYQEENEEFAKLELISQEKELFKKIAKISRLEIINHSIPIKDNTDKIINLIKKNICE